MDEIPKVFDWVKARSECSLRHVFLQLAEVVDSDVKSIVRQSSREQGISRAKFTLDRVSEDKFIVVKTWNDFGAEQGESVVFELIKQGIAAKLGRAGKQLFVARPALTKTGDCKLRIEGEPEPLELWQVSQKALEDLFFGS